MDKRFIKNISASTSGAVINQVFGLLIFYILSNHLDKRSFGEFNWSLAVLLTAFNILACGIDQVLIKKVANGENLPALVSLYINHVLVSGAVFYLLLCLGRLLFPAFFAEHYLLLMIGIGKVMIFFSSPFKQLATGLRKFKVLLYMTVFANVVKGVGLIIFSLFGTVTIFQTVIIFIAGDLTELFLCIFLAGRFLPTYKNSKRSWQDYLALVKESLPQLGVVIFNSALSRFDWILVGLMVSAAGLADYSFAYKVFEVSTLPLLSLAPLLIPIFTVYFKNEKAGNGILNDFLFLWRLEMIVACFVAMMLNICWTPFIDLITAGKYGAVNARTVFILSLSMPLLYLNNFLWTIHFAKGHLKMILYAFSIAFLVNLSGDFMLIPYFKNEGAALAYVIAIAIQSILYFRKSQFLPLSRIYLPLLLCAAAAFTAGYLSTLIFNNIYYSILSSILLYILSLILSGQLRRNDSRRIKRLIHL